MLKTHVSAIGNSMLSSNLISISVIPDGNVLAPVQKRQRSARLAPSEKRKKLIFFQFNMTKIVRIIRLKKWVRDGVVTSIHQRLSL